MTGPTNCTLGKNGHSGDLELRTGNDKKAEVAEQTNYILGKNDHSGDLELRTGEMKSIMDSSQHPVLHTVVLSHRNSLRWNFIFFF